MKPPPFLISTAAVINYVCPTPNTNIVIFWEGRGGSWFISLWWLKEWDEWPLIMVVCRDGEAAAVRWRMWRGPAEGSGVHREGAAVWVSLVPPPPTVQEQHPERLGTLLDFLCTLICSDTTFRSPLRHKTFRVTGGKIILCQLSDKMKALFALLCNVCKSPVKLYTGTELGGGICFKYFWNAI